MKKYILFFFLLIFFFSCSNNDIVLDYMDGRKEIVTIDAIDFNPQKEGYSFLYWSTTESLDVKYDKEKDRSVKVLYAKWEKSEIDINIVIDGVESFFTTINKDETLTNIQDIKKEGFALLGLYYDKLHTRKYEGEKLKEDTTFYTKWQRKSFVVTFDDGTSLTSQRVYYGKSVENAPTPEKEGYKFIGWDEDLSSVCEDITTKAIFEKLSFEITFDLAIGGYEIIDITSRNVEYGSSYSFKIHIFDGYTPSWPIKPFVQKGLDRTEIIASNNVYTVDNITEDTLIYVQSRGESNITNIILTGYKDLKVGESIKISYYIEAPSETTQYGTFSSSDENILKVESDGLVTAINKGTATITFTAFDMKTKKSIEIKVE